MPWYPGRSLCDYYAHLCITHSNITLSDSMSKPTSNHLSQNNRYIVLQDVPYFRLPATHLHDRPHLTYNPINFKHMRKLYRIAICNVQRAFTRNLFGPKSCLSHRAWCKFLDLEPQWLRRLKLRLPVLFNPCHKTVRSATDIIREAGSHRYRICILHKLLNMLLARPKIEAKLFTFASSNLPNKPLRSQWKFPNLTSLKHSWQN